jgi:hypothetical protein
MGMTPSEFLENFVVRNLRDFEADPAELYRGMNAAISASHMGDHLFNFCFRNKPEAVAKYRVPQGRLTEIQWMQKCYTQYIIERTERETAPLNDIRSIANVYKHLYSDTDIYYVNIGSPGALVVGDNAIAVLDGWDGKGAHAIFYQTKDDRRKLLLPAVKHVVRMWEKEMARLLGLKLKRFKE